MSHYPHGHSTHQQNSSFSASSGQSHVVNSQFHLGTASSMPSAQTHGSHQQFSTLGSSVSQTATSMYGRNPTDFAVSTTSNISAPNYGGYNPQSAQRSYRHSSSHQSPMAFQHTTATPYSPSQSSYPFMQCTSGHFISNNTVYNSHLSGGGNVLQSFGDTNCMRSRTMSNGLTAGLRVANEQIWNHVQVVTNRSDPVGVCPICLDDCIPGGQNEEAVVIAFVQCNNDHQMHLACLNRMIEATPGSQQSLYLECPHCKKKYGCGVRTGNQPPGQMTCSILNQSLPGHPKTKTIQITYQIYPGVQDSTHPNPGQRYNASNFPRTCYLPDTEKGRLVRDLLKVAFDRKLIFTIGTSATTGQSNVVIWNDIHHKTEWDNYSGHGYPDPGFLDRCLDELANQGVTSQDLPASSY